MTRIWPAFLVAAILAQIPAPHAHTIQAPPGGPRFEIPRDDFLIDEPVPIVVSGLAPHATVTIRLRGGQGEAWSAAAIFAADADGRLDLAHAAPTKAGNKDYRDADAMGLFWSAERRAEPTANDEPSDEEEAAAARWTLTAEIDNAIVARASVQRRALADGVRVTPVRTDGLVGTLYEPPGGGRHPAMLVLGGSEGGIPRPAGHAGGLASRGYTALALGYFNADGLPRTLSNIPLEYFGRALKWLAAQPSVDATRVGVVGASRGAELALLLGVTYPNLRLVVAYMPSNVINRGCCDMSAQVAWTLHGRPVGAPPAAPGRRFGFDTRAEIPVEGIGGPIMLVSGKDDGVWDSAPMARRIVARLDRSHFKYEVESLVYDHAGHSIVRPYGSTMVLNRRHPLGGRDVHMGGTPAGTAKAREDAWAKLLAFLDRHLRDAASR
jgi:dienelactone hydrolase